MKPFSWPRTRFRSKLVVEVCDVIASQEQRVNPASVGSPHEVEKEVLSEVVF
jgi:hypothetical protein